LTVGRISIYIYYIIAVCVGILYIKTRVTTSGRHLVDQHIVVFQDSTNNLYVNSPTDTLIISLNERGCVNRIRIALVVYEPIAQHV